MDGHAARYRKVVAGAAVVVTVALGTVVSQGGNADPETGEVASMVPTGSVRFAPRAPVIAKQRPDTPTPTSSPTSSPSEPLASSEWTQTFLSPRFRYSITYPRGWLSAHSANNHEADTFTASEAATTRLSILRRARIPGVPFEQQAKSWLPPRHVSTGGCRWNGSGIIYIAGGDVFHETSIDGHPALIRSECSIVDAAVDLGDEAMLLVLRSTRHMASGDRATFDRFVESLAITLSRDDPIATPRPLGPLPPPTPVPTQAVMFVSLRFGYSIAYPADWRVKEVTDGLVRDELAGPYAQRLTLRAVPKPRTVSARAWATENLATRVTVSDPWSTGCHWPGGTAFIPRSPGSFVGTELGGRPAVVRSECSYVDGVVDLGDRVLLISLRITAHRADGDRRTFDDVLSGLHILGKT
jgi:hypothetical protein